ncbi:MAG: DUF1559 domain-containing protein, partial [Planctomycetaceae bacterium]|nr:DUF1559 domain-containing protein [Planctomycetaceae bacterium]
GFPHACVGNPKFPPEKRWSWYLCLGNYMMHYGEPLIDYERPWDDPSLRPLQLRTWKNGEDRYKEFVVPLRAVSGLQCPSSTWKTHTDGQPFTDYVGTAGINPDAGLLPLTSKRAGAWSYTNRVTMDDITDGLSTTVIMMETGHENGCWLAGGPATVRGYDLPRPTIGVKGQFGGIHAGGAVTLFADGHVEFLADEMDPQAFSKLLTIAESEE